MKKILLFTIIAIAFMACNINQEQNIKLVKNYVESVENLDFEAMSELLDDNYLGLGPSFDDSISKPEAVANWKYNVDNLYESIQYNKSRFASINVPDGENKGEWVANWAELTIVYKNDIGEVTIWANTNYLIENGKITRSLTFYNEADALRQLGYQFTTMD